MAAAATKGAPIGRSLDLGLLLAELLITTACAGCCTMTTFGDGDRDLIGGEGVLRRIGDGDGDITVCGRV